MLAQEVSNAYQNVFREIVRELSDVVGLIISSRSRVYVTLHALAAFSNTRADIGQIQTSILADRAI